MTEFFAACGLIFTAGLCTFVFPRSIKGIIYTLFAGAGLILAALPSVRTILTGGQIVQTFDIGYPVNSLVLVIDPLCAFFILLISLSNFITGFYSIGYMQAYPETKSISFYYFFLSILFLSMLLLTAVQNAVAFLILWEIMSLSSFFLVAYEHEKKESVDSAIYYFIAMQIGFVFLLCGFSILSIKAGSPDFADFPPAFSGNPVFTIVMFILFFTGFGTKSGFIPFHTWLPKAHPQAPTPVSAAMSGIMIKTGIYGILRVITFLKDPLPLVLSAGVIIVSLISAVIGVIYAIAQHDLKKLLAYHSIENIGIIGLGIGCGMLGLSLGNPALLVCGFAGAILHTLNHFLFKSLLFLGAGAVYLETKTRNMELLGGIARFMPVTSLLFLVGSAAISGLPPLNGFMSEFAVYSGLLKGITQSTGFFPVMFVLIFSGLAFTGVLALFCFAKVYGIVFLGTPRDKGRTARKEASLYLLVPMIIIAVLIVFTGLVPQFVFRFFSTVVLSIGGSVPELIQNPSEAVPGSISKSFENLAADYSSVSFAFLIFFALFCLSLFFRFYLLLGKKIKRTVTWGCGYQKPSSSLQYSARMQYTASSFAFSFTSLFGSLVKQKVIIEKDDAANSTCNSITHIKTQTADPVEKNVIQPVVSFTGLVLKLFHWIQSGNTQQYILYGLIFLLALIIFIFGVRI